MKLIYIVILIFIILLIILVNKNNSNFNNKSTFGSVKLSDGTEINTGDALNNNGPSMKINYTTPDTLLSGTTAFMKYPIMYLVTGITVGDTTTSAYLHPGITVLLGNSNLINLTELYNTPTTYFINFTPNTSTIGTTVSVGFTLSGSKNIIRTPLTIGNTYYLGVSIQSTLNSIYGNNIIPNRYSNFLYKSFTFNNITELALPVNIIFQNLETNSIEV